MTVRLRARGNKFPIAIYPRVYFVMIYIFKLYVFEYTFSNFYILLCLFSIMFIRKSMKCWYRWELLIILILICWYRQGGTHMKMKRDFLCKERVKDAVIDCQSNVIFLNVFYHLDNTFKPYGPFCSSSFDMWALVCNRNALFNQLVRSTNRMST